jgi:hypothetical protein
MNGSASQAGPAGQRRAGCGGLQCASAIHTQFWKWDLAIGNMGPAAQLDYSGQFRSMQLATTKTLIRPIIPETSSPAVGGVSFDAASYFTARTPRPLARHQRHDAGLKNQ